MAQISPVQRDVQAAMAARVHSDTDRDVREEAERTDRSERTVRRWKHDGSGSPVDAWGQYMLNHPAPFRLVSHTQALAKRNAIDKLTRSQLIARYKELLSHEKPRETEDTLMDLRGRCWLDGAQAAERDAALDVEKAAIQRRFAELRVRRSEVYG